MSGLEIDKSRGSAVRPCPGICEGAVCCNLHVMEPVKGCPMSCSYCFLESYRPDKTIRAASDLDRMLDVLAQQASTQPDRLFRVGTGELGDSLALDKRVRFAETAVERVAGMRNVVLELKTKTNRVRQLPSLQHEGRTVVAWSMNTPRMAQQEEHGCASIEDRISAAVRVQEAGYPLGFHFDPVIDYEGCEDEYQALVERIGSRIDPDRIAWISIGTLRLDRGLPQTILAEFPTSQVPTAELVIGFDGKMRYVKPRRIELTSVLADAVQTHIGSGPFVYLCMEQEEVWERSLGWVPSTNGGFDFCFADNLVGRFPYLLPVTPRRDTYDNADLLRDDWEQVAV